MKKPKKRNEPIQPPAGTWDGIEHDDFRARQTDQLVQIGAFGARAQ